MGGRANIYQSGHASDNNAGSLPVWESGEVEFSSRKMGRVE